MIEAHLKIIVDYMTQLLNDVSESNYKLSTEEKRILSKISGRVEWLKERNK